MNLDLVCDNPDCKKEFKRRKQDVFDKDGSRKFEHYYCSPKCAAKCATYNHLKEYYGKHNDNLLKGKARDDWSNFRPHLQAALKRKKWECDLDLEHLRSVWEKQNGICIYSNIKLQHKNVYHSNDPRVTASLDRIDSNKGYIKGNVQFTSICVNHLKSKMTDEQTKEYFQMLRESLKDNEIVQS